jgi:hypothetical protein
MRHRVTLFKSLSVALNELEHDPKSLNQKVIFTHWVL